MHESPLHDRAADPLEQRDVAVQHHDACNMMKARLEKFWDDAQSLKP